MLWAWIGQRKGNHALLSIGSYVLGLTVLVPLTVTLVPSTIVDPTEALGFSYPFDLRVGYFALTFVFLGCAWSGMYTGRMTYILVPHGHRLQLTRHQDRERDECRPDQEHVLI